MASKHKRQLAREKHRRQKRRAKYSSVLKRYDDKLNSIFNRRITRASYEPLHPFEDPVFAAMIKDICNLHVKILQQLLDDLKSDGYISRWSGDYHRVFIDTINSTIFERTVMK